MATTASPTAISANRSLKPALKLTPPPNNMNLHLPLPPSDFSALVSAAIRARPSPRRNCPDFHFCDTERAPVAPPPTPSMGPAPSIGPESTVTPASSTSGSTSGVRVGVGQVDVSGVAGEVEEMMLTPGSEGDGSGRWSYESRRSCDGGSRRVRFE